MHVAQCNSLNPRQHYNSCERGQQEVCVRVCVCDKHKWSKTFKLGKKKKAISSSASPVRCCCGWPVSSLQTWRAETPDSYSGIFLMRIHKFPKKRYKARKKKKHTHVLSLFPATHTRLMMLHMPLERERETERLHSQPGSHLLITIMTS